MFAFCSPLIPEYHVGSWCMVTVSDGDGRRHSLDVQAESSYDAAHLYLHAAKSNPASALPVPGEGYGGRGRDRRQGSGRVTRHAGTETRAAPFLIDPKGYRNRTNAALQTPQSLADHFDALSAIHRSGCPAGRIVRPEERRSRLLAKPLGHTPVTGLRGPASAIRLGERRRHSSRWSNDLKRPTR